MSDDLPPFEISVDSRLLTRLHGPGANVVFASGDERVALAQRLPPGVLGLLFEAPHRPPERGRLTALLSADRPEPTVLEGPPAGPCLLVALSEPGRRELAELERWWAAVSRPDARPPLVELVVEPADDPSRSSLAVAHRLFELAGDELGASARRESGLRAQLFELREAYEQAEAEIEGLQGQLRHLRGGRRYLQLARLPSPESFRPAGDQGEVRQRLLLPLEGLAGFDLHVAGTGAAAAAKEGKGALHVELLAREQPQVVGRWTFPYESVGPGWLRCDFPSVLVRPFSHLELSVRWDPASGSGPALSLAGPAGPEEGCVRVGERGLGRGLALLAWAGVPGMRRSEESPSPPGEVDFDLSPADFLRIVPTDPDVPASHCHPLGGDGGLFLHPGEGGSVTTAVLPGGCPPGTREVIALARITNPLAASSVDYALCLTPVGTRVGNGWRFGDGALAFSGWVTVPPDGETHVVALAREAPLAEGVDLRFATRVSPGQSTSYCWATWPEVRIRARW